MTYQQTFRSAPYTAAFGLPVVANSLAFKVDPWTRRVQEKGNWMMAKPRNTHYRTEDLFVKWWLTSVRFTNGALFSSPHLGPVSGFPLKLRTDLYFFHSWLQQMSVLLLPEWRCWYAGASSPINVLFFVTSRWTRRELYLLFLFKNWRGPLKSRLPTIFSRSLNKMPENYLKYMLYDQNC